MHNLWTNVWTWTASTRRRAALPEHGRRPPGRALTPPRTAIGVGQPTWMTVTESNEHFPEPAAAPRLDTVWRNLVEDLPPNQRAWLAGSMPVTLHENTAIIAVGNEFTRSQIEGRLRTRLEDSLGAIFDRQVRIAVTVDPELGGGTTSGDLPLPPEDTLRRERVCLKGNLRSRL